MNLTKNKIGGYLSDKISITVFFATILVVLRHSSNVHIYYPEIYSHGFQDINSFIQIFTNSLTNIAVPFFFIISGFLFFYNYEIEGTFLKWKRRIASLLIPYIIWNILIIIFFYIIQNWIWASGFSNYNKIDLKLDTLLSLVIFKPALGQFWYIRDLMIFVLLAPLLLLTYQNKYFSLLLFVSLLIFWVPVDTSICSSEGFLFFNIGGYLGHYKNQLSIKGPKKTYILLSLVFWVCLKLILIFKLLKNNDNLASVIEKDSILIGIFFFWNFSEVIIQKLDINKLKRITAYSFFIYAFHSPLIKAIYKVLLSIFPRSQLTGIIVYFITPALVIALSIIIAKALIEISPRIYNVLVGNRLKRR